MATGSSTVERMKDMAGGIHGEGPHEFELRFNQLSDLTIPADLAKDFRPFLVLCDSSGKRICGTKNLVGNWSSIIQSGTPQPLSETAYLKFRCNADTQQSLLLQLWHDAPILKGKHDAIVAQGVILLADLKAAPLYNEAKAPIPIITSLQPYKPSGSTTEPVPGAPAISNVSARVHALCVRLNQPGGAPVGAQAIKAPSAVPSTGQPVQPTTNAGGFPGRREAL